MAALRLSGKTKNLDVELTLVNATPNFIQRPRLHHLAVDQQIPEVSIKDLLQGTSVNFLEAWVSRVDPDAHQVVVQMDGKVYILRYDYLLFALGSRVDRSDIPGVHKHAYALDPCGPMSAQALRERLKTFEGMSKRVVVVVEPPGSR
jgi:NADH dehydrogenase